MLSRLEDERDLIKASKFTGVQSAIIVPPGKESTLVAEICRKVRISHATCFIRKTKYAVLRSTEIKRLKQLEDQTSRLKTTVADLTLDREIIQDVIRRKI